MSSDNVKGSLETIAEGFCLALLTCSWVPSVIVVTTPGGFASQVGNAYFFTWATTVFVMETFLWFIHDSRGNVQKAILEKEKEYKKHQERVLRDTQEKLGLTNDGSSEEVDTSSISDEPKEKREENISDWDDNDDDDGGGSPKRLYPARMPDPPAVDDDSDKDDIVETERRLKQTNKKAYFNSLSDILE